MGVLPDAPIHAALVQLQETLRSERRGWGWKSLTRHHFAHVVQRRDGALKTRTVSVQIRPWAPPRVAQCRGVPLKPERLQVQVLPRGPAFALRAAAWQAKFGMSTGKARRASVLTSACLRASGASPRHSAICARSSKRAGGLIPRIALDQCRDPERYRTRASTFAKATAWQAILNP